MAECRGDSDSHQQTPNGQYPTKWSPPRDTHGHQTISDTIPPQPNRASASSSLQQRLRTIRKGITIEIESPK
ncbi:hypothetical protein Nepgr_006726 [Nepenthes gracilis]|uniref:Uncharacterized protein n=1 Tax=Nepenthes gracilis TaxID=150966 RepID=A0AAD3S5T1_NEPGR|nr:hypothetical protein Nepgr_006726 [Nepenthes gracilis]